MKRSSVRAFGIALFLAGALYTTIDQFHINLASVGIKTPEQVNNKTIASLKQQLQTANKKIESLQSQTSSTKTSNSEQPSTSEKQVTKKMTDEQKKIDEQTYTLVIYRNMSIYTICQKLEEAGIIDNALELEMYLAKDQYLGKLQIGEYSLNTSMSLEEIANTITKTTEKEELSR